MTTYFLRIPPREVVRLVRAERDAAGGQPELYEDALKDYVIEEEYDRHAYGLPEIEQDGRRYDLITVEAVLNVEPRVERDFWVLSVVVRKNLGPQIVDDEERALVATALTLDEFEREFLAPGAGRVTVRLETETPLAKQHFDDWWAALNARHAPGGGAARELPPVPPLQPGLTKKRRHAMAEESATTNPSDDPWSGHVREAVGVFANADALESAVDALEIAGFDRARISVLGSDEAVKSRIGRLYSSVTEIEDDSRAPHAAFASRDSRAEGEAAAFAIPLYVGGFAGAAAIAAVGGALAVAIGVTLVGAAAGAGVGLVIANAVARHHAHRIHEQLAQGGVVLWVSLADAAAEKRALDVLTKAGARDIHVHEIERKWGPEDSPLSLAGFDPFLERDPVS